MVSVWLRAVALVCLLSGFAFPVWSDPIPFIENKNQWPSGFKYAGKFQNHKVFLTPTSFYFLVFSDGVIEKGTPAMKSHFEEMAHLHNAHNSVSTFEISFGGAACAMTGEAPQATRHNFFIGSDRSRWGSGALGFSSVTYSQVYPGIDLKVHSSEGLFKYDWVVEPCADPSRIILTYHGVDDLCLQNRSLHLSTKSGALTEMRPVAWQIINGVQRHVACDYVLEENRVQYVFPEGYDTNYELVIDPILIFSGYSGSSYDNWGNTATYDSRGNLYSGGIVTTQEGGIDFPVTPGSYQPDFGGGTWDIGILKYDSAGSNLLYVTYLGGQGSEVPQSLVVNSKDELLVLGTTGSDNFPVSNQSQFRGGKNIDPLGGMTYFLGTDIFVAKLSSDGTQLLGATYLGGTENDGVNFISGSMSANLGKVESPLSRNYGDQLRGDIITDEDDNVLIATVTLSDDFPVINSDPGVAFNGGRMDAIAVKLSADLSQILWTRPLGGAEDEAAYSIKIAPDRSIYIAGGTTSSDFEGMNGLGKQYMGSVDGWIAHLSEDGTTVLNGTYLGTTAYDQSYFIDLTSSGDVVAYGQTQGSYPVSSNVYVNANSGQFIHKLTPDLATTVFSTVVGSGDQSPNISPTAFLVSDCNTIYLSGWGGATNSVLAQGQTGTIIRNYVGGNTEDLPITPDANKKNTSGNDFYFMVLSGDASHLLYATYLGGAQSKTHVDGGTSRFDKRGIVYHAVCAGCGGHSDFPAVNVPIERRTNRSSNCNNAAFKFDLSLLKARVQPNSVDLTKPGLNEVCLRDTIVFQNKSTGGKIFEWNMGDGTTITRLDTTRIVHVYSKVGSYTVKLTAIDEGTCLGIDSVYTNVQVNSIEASVPEDGTICEGSSVRLSASGGVVYTWTSDDKLFNSTEPNPLVTPKDSTVYFVTITNLKNCVHQDTVRVDVVPALTLDFSVDRIYDCFGRPDLRVQNLSEEEAEYFFDFGDGGKSDLADALHQFSEDGVHTVRLYGKREFCMFSTERQVPIYTIASPNVITPLDQNSLNDRFRIVIGSPEIKNPFGDISLKIYNRWGQLVYANTRYQGDWMGDGVEAGVYYYEVEIAGETTCKSWIHVMK